MVSSREEGRRRDSDASKCVFGSKACFSSTWESPTQSCFFGVYACSLTCVFDRLHVCEMVNLKGPYLRVSGSPKGSTLHP